MQMRDETRAALAAVDTALELLDSGSRPTAIVASNDFAAVGVLSALAELGLSSPDDVSVVGYDNSILAHLQRG